MRTNFCHGSRAVGSVVPSFALALAMLAGPLSGQDTGAPKGAKAKTFREPTWLMPPIEGPNLHYKTFDSKTAGEKVSYLIYLPPDYETAKDKRYPVVYWLHGIGGSQEGVPTVAQRLNQYIN